MVEGRPEAQADLQALPAGDDPIRGMRRLHEGLPHTEVRGQGDHGPLLGHGIGAGQGTHLLEGYTLRDLGYFGPGELPSFNTEFFHGMPHGRSEDMAFEDLKEKILAGDVTDDERGDAILRDFKVQVEKYVSVNPEDMATLPEPEEA